MSISTRNFLKSEQLFLSGVAETTLLKCRTLLLPRVAAQSRRQDISIVLEQVHAVFSEVPAQN